MTSSNHLPFSANLSFGKRKMLWGAKSGE